MNKTIQAKDLSTDLILAELHKRPGEWHTHWPSETGMMPSLAPLFPDVPEKVLRAKLSSMQRQGLIAGCGCGCRGDWHVGG